MQYQEMRELMRELINQYIRVKLEWVGAHETTEGFDEWFTAQVGIKMAPKGVPDVE